MPLPQTHRPFVAACAVALTCLLPAAHGRAQAVPTASVTGTGSTANGAGPPGIIPFNHGFNVSLGASSQHDSSNGWSSILTPGAAYRFSPAFSINASIPIYTSINIQTNTGTKAKPVYVDATKHAIPGDAAVAAVFETHPEPFDYTATIAIGLPSGDTDYGLGTGYVSYNFNNHFEKSFGIFSPGIDAGITNSSRLIAARVHKNYTAAGTLAHLQLETSIDLPRRLSFDVDAYEDLPVSSANIYSTGRSKKKTTTTASSTAAEDNGLDASLDIPLNGHVTFSTFYNHSIRSHNDIAGISLTFVLQPKNDGITE